MEGFDLVPGERTGRVLDIAAPDSVKAFGGFEVLCHLAARISVEESLTDPRAVTEVNVVGTVQMLEAARRNDARLIFVSSAAVYGPPTHLPISEDDPCNPTSPYGLTKVIGEQYVALYRDLYGLPAVTVRPFNVYSERTKTNDPYAGVIRRFVENARAGRPIEIHGDGGQTRDFVHVSDVVQLIGLLLEGKAKDKVFNCGTGKATRILDLAETVRRRLNPAVRIVHGASRPGDIRQSWASIERAERVGYRPAVTLDAWLSSLASS